MPRAGAGGRGRARWTDDSGDGDGFVFVVAGSSGPRPEEATADSKVSTTRRPTLATEYKDARAREPSRGSGSLGFPLLQRGSLSVGAATHVHIRVQGVASPDIQVDIASVITNRININYIVLCIQITKKRI